MKNSAWDHKLWAEKLDQLPLKQDADFLWNDMKATLDKEMPQPMSKPPIFKLNPVGWFALLLVVAVLIVAFLFYLNHQNTAEIKPADRDRSQLNKVKTETDKNLYLPRLKNEIKLAASSGSHSKPVGKTPSTTAKNSELEIISDKVINATPDDFSSTARNFPDLKADDSVKKAHSLLQRYLPTQRYDQPRPVLPMIAFKDSQIYIRESNAPVFKTGADVSRRDSTGYRKVIASAVIGEARQKSTNQSPLDVLRNQKREVAKKMMPRFQLGIFAGISSGKNSHLILAGDASVKLSDLIYLNPALVYQHNRVISGEIVHPSFFRPDSIPPFSVADRRKVKLFSIPVRLEFKLSDQLSVKAGPIFHFLKKGHTASTTIGELPDKRDTLNQGINVDRSLQQTALSIGKLGFDVGLAYEIGSFKIAADYTRNFKKDVVTSPLGNYSTRFTSVQLTLGYQLNFGKKKPPIAGPK